MNEYDSAMVAGPGDMYGAVGLDEIIGGAPDEIIGALDLPALRKLGMLRQAGGVAVKAQVRDKVRIQPAPWTPVAVLASGTTTISIQPQRLIQIRALVLPSSLGTLFNLTDLRVGQQTQFITSGSCLAQLFSEVADGDRSKLKLDSADVGNIVALDFANLDTLNTQTLRGMLVCISVYA
jgi:hypothetical protein